MEHLQRVWLASRERLPFRTPGSVPHFGTCQCSNCWDQIPRTCHVFTRLFTSNTPWYFLDFAHYFVFVFLRFVFFSFLFVTFLLVFFSFFFLSVSFRFFFVSQFTGTPIVQVVQNFFWGVYYWVQPDCILQIYNIWYLTQILMQMFISVCACMTLCNFHLFYAMYDCNYASSWQHLVNVSFTYRFYPTVVHRGTSYLKAVYIYMLTSIKLWS